MRLNREQRSTNHFHESLQGIADNSAKWWELIYVCPGLYRRNVVRNHFGSHPKAFPLQRCFKLCMSSFQCCSHCQAGDLLHHLLRKREDASRAIGSPWPNPAVSNERPATFLWLARPSSKLSKPIGSPRPMMFMQTSPANSISPELSHTRERVTYLAHELDRRWTDVSACRTTQDARLPVLVSGSHTSRRTGIKS